MSTTLRVYKRDYLPPDLKRRNLQKILQFYLIECPVPGKSEQAKTFETLGWIGVPNFSRLKAAMLEKAHPSLKDNYHPCKKDDLAQRFQEVKQVFPVDEYCVFLKSDEKVVMQSLFSAIRNALAHGSFSIRSYGKTRIYFFANFKNYMKAEIILHEQTLLEWIKLVQHGPGT